ncbi:MAG: sulfatase-like hydrolase/transferase, partial [Planctomycetota bacterium]
MLSSHWYSYFLLLIVLSSPSFVAAQTNIVHIIADDLGWTDIQSGLTNYGNGSQFYQTPTLNRLAQEGLSFTSAYALQSCAPTRAALLTGQYPTRTGVYTVGGFEDDPGNVLVSAPNTTRISANATTIGETLQSAGYTTAHFGKFHISQSDDITREHGYDFDFGGSNSGGPNSYFAAQQGNNWRFDQTIGPGLDPYADPYTQAYVDTHLAPFSNGADVDSLVGTPKHLNDAMADALEGFVEQQASSTEPFYMNVAFNAVHLPIQPRPDLHAKYDTILANNGGTSPDSRHTQSDYAALLEGMDQAIGRLLSKLDDPNGDGDTADSVTANTLVIFQGDNGGASTTSNAPLSGSKGSQLEGGLRVPMIAWMPGTVANTVTDEMVHPVDLYPTMAEFAGASLPDPRVHVTDGHSLGALLRGETELTNRDTSYFHFPGNTNRLGPSSTATYRAGTNRIKVSYDYVTRSYSVYDLNADIGESQNLVESNLGVLEYKLASRAVHNLRGWLDSTDADFPAVQATGQSVRAPDHLPEIHFQLGSSSGIDLTGMESASLQNLGITLTLNAQGDNATLSASTTGVGVASSFDTGGQNQRRRINGDFAVPERIELSFSEDVLLKSLDLGNLASGDTEELVLEFIEGDNPFVDLDGYNTGGFTLESDLLRFGSEGMNGPL